MQNVKFPHVSQILYALFLQKKVRTQLKLSVSGFLWSVWGEISPYRTSRTLILLKDTEPIGCNAFV